MPYIWELRLRLELLEQIAGQVGTALDSALAYREIAELKDKLAGEKLYLEDEIKSELRFGEIVGRSEALRHVLSRVETVAATGSTVLITGETGTGKELVSEAIPLLKSVGSNAPRLTALSEEVTRVEGHSDFLHDNGLKDLYRRHGTGNAMGYIIGSKIYGELEKVLDRFEDVAKEISGIVIENV